MADYEEYADTDGGSIISDVFADAKEYARKKIGTTDPWANSPFAYLTRLTLDARGSWGEYFLSHLLANVCGKKVFWDDTKNTNQDDGTYDLIVNGKRIEVKTAYIGKSKTWQHDGILGTQDDYDLLALIDIDYYDIHITFITSEYIFEWAPKQVRDPILGKKFTLRQKEEDKYKFDFSRTTMKRAIEAGWSTSISHTDNGELDYLVREYL